MINRKERKERRDDSSPKARRRNPVGIDAFFIPFVKGALYDCIWANKVKSKFGRTFVWFASLDDLVHMKKAAGRPKDEEALKFLRRLKQRKARRQDYSA